MEGDMELNDLEVGTNVSVGGNGDGNNGKYFFWYNLIIFYFK